MQKFMDAFEDTIKRRHEAEEIARAQIALDPEWPEKVVQTFPGMSASVIRRLAADKGYVVSEGCATFPDEIELSEDKLVTIMEEVAASNREKAKK